MIIFAESYRKTSKVIKLEIRCSGCKEAYTALSNNLPNHCPHCAASVNPEGFVRKEGYEDNKHRKKNR